MKWEKVKQITYAYIFVCTLHIHILCKCSCFKVILMHINIHSLSLLPQSQYTCTLYESRYRAMQMTVLFPFFKQMSET